MGIAQSWDAFWIFGNSPGAAAGGSDLETCVFSLLLLSHSGVIQDGVFFSTKPPSPTSRLEHHLGDFFLYRNIFTSRAGVGRLILDLGHPGVREGAI